jgi:hypothetical protein
VHYGHDMSDIPRNEELLELLEGLEQEKVRSEEQNVRSKGA